jgi:hypothetical protein
MVAGIKVAAKKERMNMMGKYYGFGQLKATEIIESLLALFFIIELNKPICPASFTTRFTFTPFGQTAC